jgi:EAL domain-containing protein (putative c-di-GMP-specific phosphodiesterase class I)
VGDWILETACAQAALWRNACLGGFRMGVNLFEAQFRAGDLPEKVMGALSRHKLPPNALELEITENIALDNEEVVLSPLRELRDIGVGIAFDDFGTGYASLSLLKHYPLTRLKIDRSFVQQIAESRQDEAVVRAVVDIARDFGLQVIAEGVEMQAQRDKLYQYGCEEAQGYLFGRPGPADALSPERWRCEPNQARF